MLKCPVFISIYLWGTAVIIRPTCVRASD